MRTCVYQVAAVGIASLSWLCGNDARAAGDLFISEYVEGSSYNKAIEIYNGTGAAVNLSSYELQYYFNGKTSAGRYIPLSGTLAPGAVYVVAHSSASQTVKNTADLLTGGSWYNGNDAVALLNGGAVIDVIGQIGVDLGSEWGSGNTSTKDNTLYRLSSVCEGDSNGYDAFDPSVQWTGAPNNTFSGLGSHTADCGATPPPNGSYIHDIQGSGASSPIVGQQYQVEAIVVGDFQGSGSLGGFFIQEEDSDADNDPLTSEGIFVYQGASGTAVNVGDKVSVSGTVSEFNGLTELTSVTVTVVSNSNPLPSATPVNLPLADAGYLESVEGMLVNLQQQLTVTENYDLGRYGTVLLSFGGRLMQPTNIVAPGAAALAQQAVNDLNKILIDDGNSAQNPDPIIYPAPDLTAFNTLRGGDSVTGLTGVVDYSAGSYRIQPTQTPNWVPSNTRTPSPAVIGGSLRVASFNVLNYFNGDGNGGGFPTARGANTYTEFQRQHDKIVAAIFSLQADIIGLMEIENDGYGSQSAIAELVNGLNAVSPVGTSYSYVNPGVSIIGTDQIAVGLIYRVETVNPVGAAKILDSSVDPRFIDTKNRPVLAQTFSQVSNGERLTVAVNHFKSKGSACSDVNDPDTGDGQGNCNLTRTSAAQALVDWLAADPTNSGDSDSLIIGDLNSYAKEDPITAIKNDDYTDLHDHFLGAGDSYSYVYFGQAGYLDHALASANLLGQVTGVTVWHINADEPHVLDYNTEFKTSNQINTLYNADAYRASDHDPVVIGLGLTTGVQ